MKTAREIAFELINDWQIPGELEDISVLEKRIERAITEAVEAEREACAQIARATAPAPFTPNLESLAAIAYRIAERIRARTPAKGDGK